MMLFGISMYFSMVGQTPLWTPATLFTWEGDSLRGYLRNASNCFPEATIKWYPGRSKEFIEVQVDSIQKLGLPNGKTFVPLPGLNNSKGLYERIASGGAQLYRDNCSKAPQYVIVTPEQKTVLVKKSNFQGVVIALNNECLGGRLPGTYRLEEESMVELLTHYLQCRDKPHSLVTTKDKSPFGFWGLGLRSHHILNYELITNQCLQCEVDMTLKGGAGLFGFYQFGRQNLGVRAEVGIDRRSLHYNYRDSLGTVFGTPLIDGNSSEVLQQNVLNFQVLGRQYWQGLGVPSFVSFGLGYGFSFADEAGLELYSKRYSPYTINARFRELQVVGELGILPFPLFAPIALSARYQFSNYQTESESILITHRFSTLQLVASYRFDRRGF